MRAKRQRAAKTNRRAAGRDAAARPQPDLYGEVTARIVAELAAGRFPWVQPWGAATTTLGLPGNARTGRSYSGINILLLWGAAFERGFAQQAWLTFAQARDLGGCVRKGEHGTTIVYADRFVPDAERQRAADAGDEARQVAFLKRFTVFNIAQVDSLPPDLVIAPAPLPPRQLEPLGEQLIAASGITFNIGGDRAFYAPARDAVQVPPQPAFFQQIDYYRTAFHELTHATGHAGRLARDLSHPFGTSGYAREELVAELGAAFLCARLGIVPSVRHADYLAGWLDLLTSDKRALIRAAAQASKAADWLFARYLAAAPDEAA